MRGFYILISSWGTPDTDSYSRLFRKTLCAAHKQRLRWPWYQTRTGTQLVPDCAPVELYPVLPVRVSFAVGGDNL